MNYIGSKASLLDFLNRSIASVVDPSCQTFCDLFAGTGAVGRFFKTQGYTVIANDLQYYSYVLNKHYIETIDSPTFSSLTVECPNIFQFLSDLEGKEGFIYRHYAKGGDAKRQYFSDENAKKCDAVRQQIETWKTQELLTESEYFYLLASLLESIDKVANTASVYGAFLKTLKKSAQVPLILKPAQVIPGGAGHHRVFNVDANTLIEQITPDILYLDPPYNHRQYAANYHVLETIARYDSPVLYGETGLRECPEQRSDYCLKSKVKQAFTELILKAKAKYIFLSYNNEGLLSLDEIKEIMSLRGGYRIFTQPYARYKADSNRDYSANSTLEYLHAVKVS